MDIEADGKLLAAIKEHLDEALAQHQKLTFRGGLVDHIAIVPADVASALRFLPPGWVGSRLVFMARDGYRAQFQHEPDVLDAIEDASPADVRVLALGWGQWRLKVVPSRHGSADA